MAKVKFVRKVDILYVEWPKEVAPSEIKDAMSQMRRELIMAPCQVAIINNLLETKLGEMFSQSMREEFSKFVKSENDLLTNKVVSAATVTSSWFIRSFARMIRLATDPPYVEDVFATVEEAEKWSKEQLKDSITKVKK